MLLPADCNAYTTQAVNDHTHITHLLIVEINPCDLLDAFRRDETFPRWVKPVKRLWVCEKREGGTSKGEAQATKKWLRHECGLTNKLLQVLVNSLIIVRPQGYLQYTRQYLRDAYLA